MKRNRRTIVAVLSALCLFLLPLSACGGTQTGGNSEEAQKRTPEEVIQDTIRKAQSFQSMSYSMDMEMDMKVEAQGISQTVDMTQTTQVECVVDPVQFKVDMTMDLGSLGKNQSLIYGEQNDSLLTLYISTDGGSSYTKQELSMDVAGVDLYDGTYVRQYLEMLEQLSDKGEETVNGVRANRYDAVISGEGIKGLMSTVGLFSQLTQMGMEESAMTALIDQIGDIPVTLWIDLENDTLVRYHFNMTQMVQNMMAYLMEHELAGTGISMDVNDVQMDMEITGVNNIDTITIPEAAKTA